MTDKQIIIDGVDVSGCEHRCDTHKTLLADGHIMEFENYCQITNDGCYAINCYYKQLKRAEQKLTKIKKYCTGIKKDYYWGMRLVRFANEILQIIEGKENE